MIEISSDQLEIWFNSFIWPLTRILGLIAVAPVFGHRAIPRRIKIGLGVFITLLVAPTLENIPPISPSSLSGIFILIEQFIIGLAMGLTIQMVFASIDLAGNLISMTMGLGFASFFDVQTQATTQVISQVLIIIMTMVYLSLNLHLVLLSTLVESFVRLPVSTSLLNQPDTWMQIMHAASIIFSSGVQLALPIIAALLVTNLALGILTRAAPQLNLFGIGFPLTLIIGLLMLFIIMPYLSVPIQSVLERAVQRTALGW